MSHNTASLSTALFLGVFILAMPVLSMAAKAKKDDKEKTYYVWCIYEKKLVHKSTFDLKKAEKKAKKHREEKGHGTRLLTDKPEEF